MLSGDLDTGKAILRDYIKAIVGFEKLGEATGTQPKSLIRMVGPRGNPQTRNLFSVLGYPQKQAGVKLRVAVEGKENQGKHSFRRPDWTTRKRQVVFSPADHSVWAAPEVSREAP
jgi:hypothetical protein